MDEYERVNGPAVIGWLVVVVLAFAVLCGAAGCRSCKPPARTPSGLMNGNN